MTRDISISITIRDGAQTIRFTRPKKKNALLSAMYAAMNAAIERGDGDGEVVAHLFVGAEGISVRGLTQ